MGAKKEVLERWAEAINYDYIKARLCAKIMHKRDAGPAVKLLVDT